eukprot:TRINITY_DN2586_c3_g1_i1.p1 TRINITY_DN2586_c3_g1~~TRINITY_DN2586_c3_g1_i1.p1  ORF type:complete len:515 (+),score=76.24 TRINITY_DN2586_c3_g1_i1:50-1546(+)
MSTTALEMLKKLYDGLDREEVVVESIPFEMQYPQDTNKVYHSIFNKVFGTDGTPPSPGHSSETAPHAQNCEKGWGLVREAAKDNGCGAAIASLIGLTIGDAVGHPMEFVCVNSSLPDERGQYPARRPHMLPKPTSREGRDRVEYCNALNKFSLRPGQWTDDASMSLCLADSLLVNKGYHGGDARIRWHMWWNHGYNNAFRFEAPYIETSTGTKYCTRGSVGLGGNIAMSIAEIDDLGAGNHVPDRVPSIYGSKNEDAGNGSIMRLAPVPIAYHDDIPSGEAVAERQSRGTHPGPDAVACCKFMTYLISTAITQHKNGKGPINDVKGFIDSTIADFVKTHPSGSDTGLQKLEKLLVCSPPSNRECNWDWKLPELRVAEAIKNRRMSEDGRYNGYPVIPTYWGAYCMDGLSMALWALHHSSSFSDCIVRTVNLLGDADTTGAIAGQMAGAIYGWEGILSDDLGKVFVEDLKRWDPYGEIGLRAALLYNFKPEHALHPKAI